MVNDWIDEEDESERPPEHGGFSNEARLGLARAVSSTEILGGME